MKSLLFIFIVFITSCTSKIPSYIHGYIYNEKKKPLMNIKIEDPYDSKTFTFTDEKGYFKINRLTKGEYLYILEGKQKVDSIYYIRTHPERGERYYFVEGRNDTVFINEKSNKIVRQ